MRFTSLIRPEYNLTFFAVVKFNPRTGDRLCDKSWEYSFYSKKTNGSAVPASLTLTRAFCHILCQSMGATALRTCG